MDTPREPDTTSSLKYLTVQDMIWINLQATKRVQHFSFARLEEATYYQYGYGASKDVAAQAGRFLGGFLKLHPFADGNEASGFIGCVAFLRLNGYQLGVPADEARDWIERIQSGRVRAEQALPALVSPIAATHDLTVREALAEVLSAYPSMTGQVNSGAAA